MNQELSAYVMRDDGQVSDVSTDELVVALDHLMQRSTAQRQSMSADKAAVYEFLQALKRAMRTAKDMERAS
jgi:hypothetical protein